MLHVFGPTSRLPPVPAVAGNLNGYHKPQIYLPVVKHVGSPKGNLQFARGFHEICLRCN